jgi:hypothetical protein
VADDATERATAWLHQRLLQSELIDHYLRLKDKGLDVDAGAEATFALAATYGLNRCAFLATVGAQLVGRERLVQFIGPSGSLIHAVIAAVPQDHKGRLRGTAVDILGRESLPEALQAFQEAFGEITVVIGDLVPDSEFEEGERDALLRVCSVLPWFRKTLLLPEPEGDPGRLLLDAAAWAMARMPDDRLRLRRG